MVDEYEDFDGFEHNHEHRYFDGGSETLYDAEWMLVEFIKHLSASELEQGALGLLEHCHASVINVFIQSAIHGPENYKAPREVIVTPAGFDLKNEERPDTTEEAIDLLVQMFRDELNSYPTADGDDVPGAEKL